jgi:hypothetical protein
MHVIFESIIQFFRWIGSFFWKKPASQPTEPQIRYIDIPQWKASTPNPPAGHWAPCHPATVKRFKASMTCPAGHGLVLKGHHIFPDGRVHPSVVCPNPGCSFHEFVKLEGWTFGDLP